MIQLFRLGLFLFLVASESLSPAGQQDNQPRSQEEPILRVESGFHTAAIKRIGVDPTGRWVGTVSNDKTLRLFDAATGDLLFNIRVPINLRNDGKLYSIAVSPDGKTIAAAGWNKLSGEGHAIFFFDSATGTMQNVVAGLDNVIHDLSFSPDGSKLAAGLGRDNGVRLIDMHSMSLVAENRDYNKDVYGVDFAANGHLVTVSHDGFIRLYDNNLNLLKKTVIQPDARPFQVRFSPDGREIAVGYDGTTTINILRAIDLSLAYSPDTSGVDNGDLSKVCWSADGQKLYAGGMWKRNGKRQIRIWDKRGRGSYQDLDISNDTITDIKTRPGGGFFVSASDPMLAAYNNQGQQIFINRSSTPDYRDNNQGFLTSNDGSRVKFGYSQWGEEPASIDLSQRLLTLNPSFDPALESAITSSQRLKLRDWKNSPTPTLNGISLQLSRYERARAAAISPDETRVLLGANWYLRLFDEHGNLLWEQPTKETNWAVNISGNGKLALAAYGDGTIRWYRMSDGQELLAFFPHSDKRRWVAWTPSGYYMASPGGEDLIGWHVNNGGNQTADFFSAALFRDRFNRPDVVTTIFSTLDEGDAIRLADQKSNRKPTVQNRGLQLPPVVTIREPQNGFETSSAIVSILYSLRNPSNSRVTRLRAMVDGRQVKEVLQKDLSSDLTGSIEINLPPGQSRVSLIAENQNGSSEPTIIQVIRKNASQAANISTGQSERGLNVRIKDPDKVEFVIKPKLYLLSIGVSDYDDDSIDLAFAAKDATDFANAFAAQKGGLYRDVISRVLINEDADKDSILDALEWLERETTTKDIAILFLAGHGVNDDHGEYYFLPGDTNLERLRRTGLPYTEIKRTVANLAGKAIFFVDSCHSGNVMGSRRAAFDQDIDSMVNDLVTAQNGVVVFASSTGKQYSLEDKAWENGAFTKAIVEGLSGAADYHGKGKISINMLDLYVSERVKELTEGRQTPTTTKPKTVPDFPIAIHQ